MSQDDDDGLLQCTPDVGVDDEASWAELPEITTSPCGLAVDPDQTLPEDLDLFAEDWPEGGMWRLDEADTGLGEREIDAQSDESLISCSIPLASTTTPFPQAGPCALYHHQDVELDPVASGLRYKVSHLAFREEPGNSGLFANLTHPPSHALHDPRYSDNDEQLTLTCQVDSEGFEALDSWSERDEEEDSNSMLFDLDVGDSADLTAFEEPLV